MIKKISLFLLVMSAFSSVFAQSAEEGSSNAFNKYMSPEGGINPLSGTVALTKSLASISVGEVSVNFDLSYSGNVFKEMNTRNDRTSVGLVGLGWTLGRAKIVSDNRGTSFIGDDQFYLVMSSGGRFKIFRKNPSDTKDSTWWVEGNPFMKVEQVVDSIDVTQKGDYVTFVKGWRITDTKGVVHEYGDLNDESGDVFKTPKRNATEYDLFWPLKDDGSLGYGLIGTAISGSPCLYPTVWNVSKEIDIEGNFLQYFYEQIIEGLSGNFNTSKPWSSGDMKYTKESYLTKVVSSMDDSLQFVYGNKGEGDFFGEYLDFDGTKNELLDDSDVDMFVEKVNRKYLSKIVISGRNGKVGSVELCYSALKQFAQDGSKKDGFVKRLLSAVRFFNKLGEESDYEYYKYYDRSENAVANADNVVYPLGALYSVKGKECGWVEYTYAKETLGQGHMEELDVEKIYGKGYLEDGTPYLVGKKTSKNVIVYHRLNGSWVQVQSISVNKLSDVEFGDQGWFLVKDTLEKKVVCALVFQWNGREWNEVYKESVDNNRDFWSLKSKAMNVFAGPDYVIRVETNGGTFKEAKSTLDVVWSKWGKEFTIDTISNAMVNEGGFRIMGRKDHILVQVNTSDFSNAVKFFVYTFDSKGGVKETHSEYEQDNGSLYFLGDGYFVGVEEPSAYIGGDSRFRSWHWTGSGWVREYKDVFDNDGAYTAMDLQAQGQNYYTIRHHAKRYLTNYYWNGEKWSNNAGKNQHHYQMQDYAWFSAAWKWAGFSGSDFFVAGQSRLKCKWWGCDVKKYVYLHLYYLKDNEWSYEYIGSEGEKTSEKDVITGKDWFIEKNLVFKAWIWNGEKWIGESLSLIGKSIKDAYSLGEDAFAVPYGGKTRIYYKVGNSFLGSYDSYHVKNKKIFEPVVDKTIEYTYNFTKNKTQIAYDEANNTPLFKEMSITLPFGQGEKHSVLCDGKYTGTDKKTEYNVGLGSSCINTQRGRSNTDAEKGTALLSRQQTFYERYRDSDWPVSVYQDRVVKEIAFNGASKVTTTYKYSAKNGRVVSTKKKNGTKTTEEIIKYVSDLSSPLNEYDSKLGDANRIEAVAGGYSCIGECASGRIVSAYANGWDTVDNIFRSVSTWNMAPKKRMTKSDVESGISYIVKNGSMSSYTNWKRSSFNSKYNQGDVIETEEGSKKIKMASFKDQTSRRVYGTAAGCGVEEGLMLSGEYCGPINSVTWYGCVLTEKLDDIKGYAINKNSGNQYGHFSTKMLKLSSTGTLSATINKPQKKKYRISAWIQTKDNDSVKVIVSLGTQKQEKTVKTNSGWQMVEFEMPELQSNSATTFALRTSAPSGIRIQDIRVLPYDASSSALFWDEVWDKVVTTVDNRGVGSYVVYDNMGREAENYTETDKGDVYLASRKTFVDGSCTINASGNDKLDYVKVNGKTYKRPSAKRTFAVDAIDIDVSLGVDSASNPEVRYALVKGSETDWKSKEIEKWTTAACGGLCPISFNLVDNPEWTLFVDVAPFNDVKGAKGDYAFQFAMKKKDWVVYGNVDGFATGNAPQFMNPYDSTNVLFQNEGNDSIYRSKFEQGQWTNSEHSIVEARSVSYSYAYGKNNNYSLSLIPSVDGSDESDVLAYPKTFGSDDGVSFVYRDLKDESFSANKVKVAVSGNSSALLYNVDVRKREAPVILRDSINPTKTYQKTMMRRVADDKLYSKIWNTQSNQWVNIGSIPVFERESLAVSISGKDTVLKVVHGNLTSYQEGVVCDEGAKAFDMVSGPEGKLYVAYIGNPKSFEVSKEIVEDDGSVVSAKFAPSYIVVKRLYDTSETSMGKSVWAGPSKISGQPRYEGDIVSWDTSNLHAIDEPIDVKLAYDGQSLFMAAVYKTHPDEIFNDEENAELNTNVDYGELALTVFKATTQQNVNSDGVTYSSYLRWIPIKDNSITVAKSGNKLTDEQNRVLYMQPDDFFDLKVRGDTPYLLFSNKANGKKISVIAHDGNRWSSIGNPAFAYPAQSEKSADLSVLVKDGKVHPYVVFKQGTEVGYLSRKDRLVTMRYNANEKVDLSISALNLGADSLNESCAFRQYILNYSLNVGYESALSVKPTLRTSSDVARIDVYVNDNFVLSRDPNSNSASRVELSESLNRVELRVVGKDSTELSYYLNTVRNARPDPDMWAAGNALVANGFMVGDTVRINVTPLVPKTENPTGTPNVKDSTKLQIHVSGGWEVHVVDSLLGKESVYYGGDTISFGNSIPKDVFVVGPNNDTLVVDFYVTPDTVQLFKSSSSGNSGSSSSYDPWGVHLSDGNDDDIYQGYLSSSSCGDTTCSINSSSSRTTFYDSLSTNVPDAVKNNAFAKFQTTGRMRIGNQVSVSGALLASENIEIGVESRISGNVISGGDVFLANRSQVDSLSLLGNLQVQDGAAYGTVIRSSEIPTPIMQIIPFATGISDIIVERMQNKSVSPGAYRNFIVRERSKIQFAAGDYYFDSFWIDPNVELEFEAGSRVWVANGFNVSNFCSVSHAGNTGDLFIYLGTRDNVSIGNNVKMKAVIYAPQASVQIFDHTVFDGFVWSANFNVEPFSELR